MDLTDDFIGKIPPFEAIELKAKMLFGEEDD